MPTLSVWMLRSLLCRRWSRGALSGPCVSVTSFPWAHMAGRCAPLTST